jgi:LSD1 subclass zinc finger protein
MADQLTLSCPSCAGLLEVPEGSTNTVCTHCDTPLLLHGMVNRYIIKSSIDSTEALRAVRRELAGAAPGVVGECRVTKPFLAYVPFWLISSRIDGYVYGVRPVIKEKKVRMTAENGEGRAETVITRTIKQRKGIRAEENQISREVDMIVSAARLEPLGIPSLGSHSQMGLSGMALGRSGADLPLLYFDSTDLPTDAHVVDPTVSVTEARMESRAFLQRICEGVGVGLEQRSMYLAITAARERMVHYPLWTVDYRYRERLYRIVVDGCTGSILRGSFPGDTEHWRKVCVALGGLWAGLTPLALLAVFSGALRIPPLFMLFIAALWGLGTLSHRFLRTAARGSASGGGI